VVQRQLPARERLFVGGERLPGELLGHLFDERRCPQRVDEERVGRLHAENADLLREIEGYRPAGGRDKPEHRLARARQFEAARCLGAREHDGVARDARIGRGRGREGR
jgi:hypothetical protein